MRKSLFFLAVLVLAVPSLITAEDDLFLPCDHNAYKALAELAGDGLLPLHPWEYIKEWQISMTRYEMAFYLKDLIIRIKEDPPVYALTRRQEYIIKDLAKEFRRELTTLGVNVTYLDRLSPVDFSPLSSLDEGYQDLDVIIKAGNSSPPEETTKQTGCSDAYYYVGRYHTGRSDWDYFIFLPETNTNLPGVNDREGWEIIYQETETEKEQQNTFLMVGGELPFQGKEEIQGYYLFPLEEPFAGEKMQVEKEAYNLLTSLSRSYWINIDHVEQLKGELPLAHYTQMNHPLSQFSLMDGIVTGIQIGDLLLTTGLVREKSWEQAVGEQYRFVKERETGLSLITPSYFRQAERITNDNATTANYWHFDLQGRVAFHENTLVYGGLRWRYEQDGDYLRRLSMINSLLSAGVSFRVNDYLRMLVDYQRYSDATGRGNASQALLGLEWGDNTLLTLKYRMLSAEQALISGELTLKF